MHKESIGAHKHLLAHIRSLEQQRSASQGSAYLGGRSRAVALDFARRLEAARSDLQILLKSEAKA